MPAILSPQTFSESAAAAAGMGSRWQAPLRRFAPIVTVFIVTAALFLPVCRYQFSIVDDGVNVFANPCLNLPHAQHIGYLWTHPYYYLYMPVTYTLWGLCARIAPFAMPRSAPPGGATVTYLNPAVFHAANLVLHTLNVLLVFALLRRLRFRPWPSAAGALLFAVHPVQVQSVAWITGFNNLTGGFFGLLSLTLYLQHIREPDDASMRQQARTVSRVYLSLATLSFMAALLSKPTAIVFPLFLAILEGVALRRPFRTWAAMLTVWLALALACTIETHWASSALTTHVWSPWWGRPFVAGDALAFYIVKLILPLQLTYDYARSPLIVLGYWWAYIDGLLPALIFALLYKRGKKTAPTVADRIADRTPPWRRVGALLFLAGVLPTLGLVPFYSELGSTVCDRFLYLALVGPALIVADLLSQPFTPRETRAVNGGAIVVLFLFGLQTSRILPVWRSANSLIANILQITPDSALAHDKAAQIDEARGDLNGALREYETEARVESATNPKGRYFVGTTLVEMGRHADAVAPLASAFRLEPRNAEYWYQLWNVLAYLKRYEEAAAVARQHLSADPQDASAQFALGKTLFALHEPEAALPVLQAAERGLPQEGAVPFYIGAAYEQMGRFGDARAAYHQSQRLDPGQSATRAAIARLGQR